MKNKKGFTLVELLAVIVILALIMSIAVISIGGVLNSTRQSTFKETAVSIINGVRQQLIVANELEVGDYVFTKALLEKGVDTNAPLGGKLVLVDSLPSNCSATAEPRKIGDNICRINTNNSKACSASAESFVRVTKNSSNVYTYQICLTAGSDNKYINVVEGTENKLLNSNDNTMIYNANGTPVNSAS